MRRFFDLRLNVLVDPAHCRDRELAEITEAALKGGATLIQVRDKSTNTRRQIENAGAVVEVAKPFGVPVIIDDRVDVCLAAGADGVHLGREDMTVHDARRLLGHDAIIGGTVHFPHEADEIDPEFADYVGIGPVFASPSKTKNDAPIGIEGLAKLYRYWKARAPDRPACAISGIGAANAADVVASGVDGIAVISAVCAADDVEAAARRLRLILDEALAGRQAA